MKYIVTGGAGFIGSCLIRKLSSNNKNQILNIDNLTYAGNLDSLKDISEQDNYFFKKSNIVNKKEIESIFFSFKPDAIIHLAAESHVDQSIDSPGKFLETNIIGTYTLLEAARKFWIQLPSVKKLTFRFYHISTDEVYGDLNVDEPAFTESHPYFPSSPYSASKASSDHIVRAWHRTYGLPILISNCSNNYGPFQFPEKLIPHMIINAIKQNNLPVYGNGNQIRDWLYVDDHISAIIHILQNGDIGETYNIGGNNELTNISVVRKICSILDNRFPSSLKNISSFEDLISFVPDRPGHDLRYAIDNSKVLKLGWKPVETFETGIHKTVDWFIDNSLWWERILSRDYMLTRLGKGG